MTPSPRDQADDLVEAFALEPQQTFETLLRYVTDHPEHAAALVDFALELQIVSVDVAHPATTRNVDVVRAELARLTGFEDASARSGTSGVDVFAAVDLRAMEKATGIARAILVALRNRNVEPASIDTIVLSKVARHLSTGLDAVRASLAMPPRIATGSAFKSQGRPRAADRRSFQYFLENSGLSEDQKRRTLEAGDDGD